MPSAMKAGAPRRSLLLGAAALVLAGIASPAARAADKQLTADFANIMESGELFRQFGDGLMHAAEVAGIKVTRYNNNLDGPTTLSNARLMVQDQPDVILEYTAVEGIGASLKRLFNDAKI